MQNALNLIAWSGERHTVLVLLAENNVPPVFLNLSTRCAVAIFR